MMAAPQPSIAHVRVEHSTWKAPRKHSKAMEASPGPGQYSACDSSFCACNSCEGITQGKTFGMRPAVYTGNIPAAVQPGPANYHVECSTIGAAVAKCDGAA